MRMFWPYATAPTYLGVLLAFLAMACSNDESAGPDAGPGGGNGDDLDADVGGGGGDVCDDLVDCATFQEEIMPAIDSAGCNGTACHDTETATQGFGLHQEPEVGSDQMAENFQAIRDLMDLNQPDNSPIYTRSVDNHAAVELPGEDADALLAWIEDAAANAEEEDEPGNTCADLENFNVGVFEDDIFPILDGFDLNQDEQRNLACTNGPCHASGGGSTNLTLDPELSPEENLENFACFVNFSNPAQSQALLCAQNRPECRVDHGETGGGDYFDDVNDLNYQAVLGYIYSSSDNSPLDLAFFAENIQPIFQDENFSDTGLTCDDSACHGVTSPGDTPANDSNFPILRNVNLNDLQGLTENFTNAASFTNFLDPEASSLFLFPTNQIAHQGGEAIDLEDDADFIEDVLLNWIGGLRPDANGFGRHWLITGTFLEDDVTQDIGRVDENTIEPRYRDDINTDSDDPDRWREEFSQNAFVDLEARFPGSVNDGVNQERTAYAVAYVLNEDSNDVNAFLEVQSDNELHVYFGDNDQRAIGEGDNAITLEQQIPPYTGEDGDLRRILIRVTQSADSADDFGFQAQFTDEDGDLLTDDTGELVFVLGPQGGV